MINTLPASTCELVDEYSNSPVSDVQAENFFFQVNFMNCYLREIISFTKKIDIRDWDQSIPICAYRRTKSNRCYERIFYHFKILGFKNAKINFLKKISVLIALFIV